MGMARDYAINDFRGLVGLEMWETYDTEEFCEQEEDQLQEDNNSNGSFIFNDNVIVTLGSESSMVEGPLPESVNLYIKSGSYGASAYLVSIIYNLFSAFLLFLLMR